MKAAWSFLLGRVLKPSSDHERQEVGQRIMQLASPPRGSNPILFTDWSPLWGRQTKVAQAAKLAIAGLPGSILNAVMHLAPNTVTADETMCPWSSPGCREACLNSAGRGAMNVVQLARSR